MVVEREFAVGGVEWDAFVSEFFGAAAAGVGPGEVVGQTEAAFQRDVDRRAVLLGEVMENHLQRKPGDKGPIDGNRQGRVERESHQGPFDHDLARGFSIGADQVQVTEKQVATTPSEAALHHAEVHGFESHRLAACVAGQRDLRDVLVVEQETSFGFKPLLAADLHFHGQAVAQPRRDERR